MITQKGAPTITEPLRAQLVDECQVMIRAALENGRELPAPMLDVLDALERRPELGLELPTLAAIYGQLVAMSAPATPAGLRMMQEDARLRPRLHVLGPVPSIRYLMLAAFIFSLVFFGVSLFADINRMTLAPDIYDMSGQRLLKVLTFLLSAAGLGATFGALFDAYQYVSEGRYDTTYDSLYWTRIGLGLVSGLMLAELLPQSKNGELLERPLLALLGGFSASVVHRVLQRLVGALESIFAPTGSSDTGAAERAVRDRVNEQVNAQRGAMSKAFDTLLEGVAAGGSLEEARKGLIGLMAENRGMAGGLVSRVEAEAAEPSGSGNSAESPPGKASEEPEPEEPPTPRAAYEPEADEPTAAGEP